jgi:hypothetical protein
LVHTVIADGDALFTGWRGCEWSESSCELHPADEKNPIALSFITLDRT